MHTIRHRKLGSFCPRCLTHELTNQVNFMRHVEGNFFLFPQQKFFRGCYTGKTVAATCPRFMTSQHALLCVCVPTSACKVCDDMRKEASLISCFISCNRYIYNDRVIFRGRSEIFRIKPFYFVLRTSLCLNSTFQKLAPEEKSTGNV